MRDRFRGCPTGPRPVAVTRARRLDPGGGTRWVTGAVGRLRGRAVAGPRAQEQLEEQPPLGDRDGLLTAVERLPAVQEAALVHDEVVPGLEHEGDLPPDELIGELPGMV